MSSSQQAVTRATDQGALKHPGACSVHVCNPTELELRLVLDRLGRPVKKVSRMTIVMLV